MLSALNIWNKTCLLRSIAIGNVRQAYLCVIRRSNTRIDNVVCENYPDLGGRILAVCCNIYIEHGDEMRQTSSVCLKDKLQTCSYQISLPTWIPASDNGFPLPHWRQQHHSPDSPVEMVWYRVEGAVSSSWPIMLTRNQTYMCVAMEDNHTFMEIKVYLTSSPYYVTRLIHPRGISNHV